MSWVHWALRRFGQFLLLILGLLVPAAEALARAGGGGGYHGGGGGHGDGGGGDGGGIIWLIFELLRLCIYYPAIGVPVVIAIVAFFIYAGSKGNDARTASVIRRGNSALSEQQKDAAVRSLRANDPMFDEATFHQRVRLAFDKIQAAWCEQELSAVRPFISDGVYERFSLQFAEQRAEGYRDHMEQIHVIDLAVADVGGTGLFNELAVRIRASAIDYRVSLGDGRRISGSTAPEAFVEIWTFLRRRGTRTNLGRGGLIEGNCPNCGAPIEMNQSANCTHCKALLRSGEYDWVLVEITQESEWRGARRGAVTGAAELAQRDPNFDLAALEDRASVMFWRKATADRTGKIDPLRKIAAEQYCDDYAKQLHGDGCSQRVYYADCAVGSVDTLGVTRDGAAERALVEVRWSGTRHVASPAGVQRREYGLFRSLFVLRRNAGATTDVAAAIASAHCPNCGAPESGGASNACEFCGTVLNDGAHGWVLDDVLPMDDPRADELLRFVRAATGPSVPAASPADNTAAPPAIGVLAWMVKVAAADGNVDASERRMLADVAARRNVPGDQLERMIQAALRGELAVPEPSSPTEARAWLRAMAATALADGRISREEIGMLRAVADRIGLTDADLRMLLNDVKAQQFQTAREALRGRG